MTALMEKAGGMFRWLKALRKALSSLPKTLDETYNRILRNLESAEQLQNAVKALQWLCFSNRPLQLTEMVEILAIEPGNQGGFDPEERLPDPMDVMIVCSTLIVFNTFDSNEDFGEGGDEDNAVSLYDTLPKPKLRRPKQMPSEQQSRARNTTTLNTRNLVGHRFRTDSKAVCVDKPEDLAASMLGWRVSDDWPLQFRV
ncbi:hypothetical protein H2202_011156 [Exophiala xenobiotica]|nr:hypothetical protein H2202_011156 [Exophiala xenobiotica]